MGRGTQEREKASCTPPLPRSPLRLCGAHPSCQPPASPRLAEDTYPQIHSTLLLLLTSRNSSIGHEETGSAAGTETRIPVADMRQEPILALT